MPTFVLKDASPTGLTKVFKSRLGAIRAVTSSTKSLALQRVACSTSRDIKPAVMQDKRRRRV